MSAITCKRRLSPSCGRSAAMWNLTAAACLERRRTAPAPLVALAKFKVLLSGNQVHVRKDGYKQLSKRDHCRN